MIEVNLLPGGKKGSARSFKFSMPGLGGAKLPDRYALFFVGAAIAALGYMGYAYLGATGASEEMEAQIAEALQDSARYSDQIARANELVARGDSIAQRVAIIQEIDVDRYVWPHLLDEVARAVPDYTWLREILYTGQDPLEVRINGRAGSIPAIAEFVSRLEASPFLRLVHPEFTQQAPAENNPYDIIYTFALVATYESPPLDEVETVPLFDDATGQQQEAVPDSTGGN